MFANDTSLYDYGKNFDSLVSNLKSKMEVVLEWVKFNRLFINWDKTKVMCFSARKFTCPLTEIVIDDVT